MTVLDINILAIVVSAIWMMVLGYLWYGPLFGKMWMDASGKTQEQMGGANPNQAMAIAGVCALVASLGMAMLISAAELQNVMVGLTLGVVASVGLVATAAITNGVFEDRKWTLTILFAAYQVMSLVGSGVIVGYWHQAF